MIRQEKRADREAVEALVQAAFAKACHADGNEHELVHALREGTSFIPELSLVMEKDEQLVGHVLFTKAMVGKDTILCLAPLSVLPAVQREGIGSALVYEGHRRAIALGYTYSVVLGDPAYYGRFGYQKARLFGIIAPEGIDEDYLMAIKLTEEAPSLCGKLVYAKEFEI